MEANQLKRALARSSFDLDDFLVLSLVEGNERSQTPSGSYKELENAFGISRY